VLGVRTATPASSRTVTLSPEPRCSTSSSPRDGTAGTTRPHRRKPWVCRNAIPLLLACAVLLVIMAGLMIATLTVVGVVIAVINLAIGAGATVTAVKLGGSM
jgi:hypothetical protein